MLFILCLIFLLIHHNFCSHSQYAKLLYTLISLIEQKMLKISKLMRTHLNTRLVSPFGVTTNDHHTKDSEVENLSYSEYPLQEIYSC